MVNVIIASVLLFVILEPNFSTCSTCNYVKNITLKITPKGTIRSSVKQLQIHSSGCIQPSDFVEIEVDCSDQYITLHQDVVVNNMPNLVKLIFDGCEIQRLSPQSFQRLPSLKTLFIREGNLTQIDIEIFSHLSSLEVISLYDNQIENIEAYAFAFIPSLQQVFLTRNKFRTIHRSWFKNSSNIDLLDFSQNKIEKISRLDFSNTPKLTRLFLDSNEIRSIENGAFSHLKNFKVLGLSHNRLTELDSDSFSIQTHIDILLINANYLNFLSRELLQRLSVRELTLEGNPWKCQCLDRIHKWLLSTQSSIKETSFCQGNHVPSCSYSDNSMFCTEDVDESMTRLYVTNLKNLVPPVEKQCARFD